MLRLAWCPWLAPTEELLLSASESESDATVAGRRLWPVSPQGRGVGTASGGLMYLCEPAMHMPYSD